MGTVFCSSKTIDERSARLRIGTLEARIPQRIARLMLLDSRGCDAKALGAKHEVDMCKREAEAVSLLLSREQNELKELKEKYS